MTPSETALAGLATIGRAMAEATPAEAFQNDYHGAARRCMAIGAARAAYSRIKSGEDPLNALLALDDFTDYWLGEWIGLSHLIDRITLEMDC